MENNEIVGFGLYSSNFQTRNVLHYVSDGEWFESKADLDERGSFVQHLEKRSGIDWRYENGGYDQAQEILVIGKGWACWLSPVRRFRRAAFDRDNQKVLWAALIRALRVQNPNSKQLRTDIHSARLIILGASLNNTIALTLLGAVFISPS